MTTRRSLFGLIAGAGAALTFARPIYATGGKVPLGPLPLVGEIPSESLLPADFTLTEIDAHLSSMWDSYKLSPEVVYFNGTWGEFEDLRRQLRRATRRAQMEGLA